MGEGMVAGFLHLNFSMLMYMFLGVVVATVIAIIPGIGGVVALALLIPLTFVVDPLAGFAVLIAAVAVTGTGNTITAILFGMPGTPSGAALIFDGYPMSQRGEGAKAVSAGLTASALGGIFGALVLALLIPVAREIVLAISSPEFFILMVLAIFAIAGVGQTDKWKALAAGGFGLLVGLVGLEPHSGVARFAFGSLYLWDGVPLVPMLIGMFAVAEMMRLSKSGLAIANKGSSASVKGGTLSGVKAAFTHWRTVIQGGLIGVGIGLLPGVGQNAASYIAYGQAARSSKRRDKFGTGEIEGVIGPDAATNATDGGQLVPTLAFGIPGGSSMAVLLAGVMILGFEPGPDFIASHLDLMWLAVYTLIIAEVMAVFLCLGLAPLLAKLTFLRSNLMIPAVLGISAVGAFTTKGRLGDIVLLLAGGLLGYLFHVGKYPKQIFVIALVLGPILEKHYGLATRLYGPEFLFVRPIAGALTALLVLLIIGPPIRRALRRPKATKGQSQDATAPAEDKQ
jgi:putative tricarboxylic transport membrane protein